jgi:hypothetical protein
VELDEGVVLVEHGGVPGFGDEAHEAGFGGCGVGAGHGAEALDDAEVVGVDGERAAAEGGEVDDSGGDLRADAFELLQPAADFFGAVLGEEVEGERADACGDLFEGLLEARGLLFGEGDDGDGSFDFGEGGVTDGLPVVGAGVGAVAGHEGPLEVTHDLLGGRSLGAGAEQRVDELGEGIPGLAGFGLAVVAEEQAVDVRELVGLFGGERAACGFGIGRGIRIGEEIGRHRKLDGVAGDAKLVAVGGGDAPGHAGGVVGDAYLAVGTEEDDAAVAAETGEEVVDGFGGGALRGGPCGYAVDGPLAEDELHDGLAPAGEGDGGGEVVCVAAAADEGAVADAAGSFGEGAAGGGSCGDVAELVEGYGAYGVVGVEGGVVDAEFFGEGGDDLGLNGELFDGITGEGGVGFTGGFGSLEGHEAFAFAGNDEFGVVDEAHAVLGGEALGSGAHEIDVGGFFEDEAGGLDGVAEALDAGDSSGAEVGTAHEEGIELDAAVAGEKGAAAGVEGVVVFHEGDGGFDGIDGGAAAGESGPAGGEGGGDASFVGGYSVVGHGPGSTVDEEDGLRLGAGV